MACRPSAQRIAPSFGTTNEPIERGLMASFSPPHSARHTRTNAKQEARTDGGNFDGIFCRDASSSLKHRNRSPMRVTKGNNFSARTALNCTFNGIEEPPAEPLFKPFPEWIRLFQNGARYRVRTCDPYRVKILWPSKRLILLSGQLHMEPCKAMRKRKMLH